MSNPRARHRLEHPLPGHPRGPHAGAASGCGEAPPGGGQPSAVPPPGAGEPPPIEGYAVDGPESGRGRNIAAGFLALLGAALIIVGSFVPWVDVDGGDAEQLVENTLISGWETSEGEVGDGVVFAVVGGMAAIIGLIILFNRANLVLKIVLILLGLVAAGLALIEAVDIADLAQEIEDFPGDAQSTFGAGLIVIWAGAVFVLLSGLVAKRIKPQA